MKAPCESTYLCAFTLLELLAAIFNKYYHNLGRVVHLSGMGGLVRLVQLQQVVRGGGAAEVDTAAHRLLCLDIDSSVAR